MKTELSKSEVITKEDLSLVGDNAFNEKQLSFILKHTPAQFVKERPAKGGGKWKYVSATYVKKCLNLMFGWDWDFEVLSTQVLEGEVVVLGKLTVRVNGKAITKQQYGNKEIIKKKDGSVLSIGNDFKAATSDALKKCAADIGIAADIYGADEFRAVNVMTDSQITDNDLSELLETATHLNDE